MSDIVKRRFQEAKGFLKEATKASTDGKAQECLKCAIHLLRKNWVQIDEEETYLRYRYQPRLQYDKLKLQKSFGSSPSGKVLFYDYRDEIEKTAKVDPAFGRINSVVRKKRAAFLLSEMQKITSTYASLHRTEKSRRKRIASLQKKQKAIIVKVRKANSEFLASKVQVRKEEQRALKEGRFWDCQEELLKEFFRVPFGKRKLVALSEKHRAALFIEVVLSNQSGPYKRLVPTQRAYLCGIDDNEEQWGFFLNNNDSYWEYDSTVEEAMATCWNVDESIVEESFRQGEILFHPCEIPAGTTLHPETEWQIAPSHVVRSESLVHNGEYFMSTQEIVVEHPTHKPVVLEAGEYRAYIHEIDPD